MMIGEPPDRAAIRSDQLTKLRALIAAIAGRNRFYSPRLQKANITADLESLDAFSQRMPLTTKQQLAEDQLASPPWGTVLTYPIESYTRFSQTSGTTRKPIRWLDTNASWEWMIGNWQRVYDAAAVGAGDRLMFTFSFGPFLGFWVAFDAASRRGCLCIPGGGLSTEGRLRMMIDSGANVLCSTPTYAIRLAESARELKIDLSSVKIRAIIVAGEAGGSIPAVRRRMEELWRGAKVYDHHGMTEVGPVSYPSRTCADALHIIESSYFAEVIDPATGSPVEKGGTGELVLTTLGRLGSPLLRYRTGDLVKPAYPDRGDMLLVGGILSRADDMVVVRSVNVYPSAVEEVMRTHAQVAEYRVEVMTNRAMTELRIQVEPRQGCGDTAALAAKLEEDLKASLSIRVPVSVVAPGTLPRFEMKAKRWVRL
ncbi:MAG: AMP-binding protein [Phycisphaeraceae bacterium]